MENKNTKTYWSSVKLFQVYSLGTPITLNISLDSSMSISDAWTNYNSTKVVLTIRDNRIEKNTKVSMDLYYSDLCKLINRLLSVAKNKEIFNQGNSVSVSKKMGTTDKSITFSFGKTSNDEKIISIKISDTSNQTGVLAIQMDIQSLKDMLDILRGIKDSYVDHSLKILNICTQQRLCDHITKCCEEPNSKLDKISDILNSKLNVLISSCDTNRFTETPKDIDQFTADPVLIEEPEGLTEQERNFIRADNGAIDELLESIPKENVIDRAGLEHRKEENLKELAPWDDQGYDAFADSPYEQKGLEEALENDDEEYSIIGDAMADLDMESKAPQKAQKVPPARNSNGFLKNLLKYKLGFMHELKSALHLVGPTSENIMFDPMGYILKVSLIDDDVIEKFRNTEGYYKIQFAILSMLKTGITNHIKTGHVGDWNPIKLNMTIDKDNVLWDIAKSSLVAFLAFAMMKRQLQKSSTIDANPDKLAEIERTIFMLKSVFLPFALSSDLLSGSKTDAELLDELTLTLREFQENGLFDSISEEYASMTSNGEYVFDDHILNSGFTSFRKVMDRDAPISTEGIDSDKDKYKLEHSFKFESVEDVKSSLHVAFQWNKPKVSNKVEKRFSLFVRSLETQKADEDFINGVKESCRKYADLDQYFKNADSVPDGALKVKRVMDMNPDFNRKVEINRRLKEFKEDPVVTETRVLDKDEGEVIKADEDLDSVLFGSDELA